MKVSYRSRRALRLQNILFVLLLLVVTGLLAWLSDRYAYQADWTMNARHTLSPASVDVLSRLHGPVSIQAFTADGSALAQHIADLLRRYQRHKQDVSLTFIDPNTAPDRVRQQRIRMDGELVLEYQGRQEHVSSLSEQGLTQALQRLTREADRWLVFVTGHGERKVFGQANHDLQTWGQQLEAQGFRMRELNLATQSLIPDNTDVLVIAGPQLDYLPGEIALLEAYVEGGGTLLWLAEPGELYGLEPLADLLAVEFVDGVVVDPTAQMYAIDDPTFAIVGEYGLHPVVQAFDVLTVFPRASGVLANPQDDWQAEELLLTTARSWSETGALAGTIAFDEDEDFAGPMSLAVAMQRQGEETAGAGQRVLVVGDGDFISNAYLGNGGNLDLAMNMINWLSEDEQLINVPPRMSLDASLNLSHTQSLVIGFGFLLVLPAALLGTGIWVWLKRRKA